MNQAVWRLVLFVTGLSLFDCLLFFLWIAMITGAVRIRWSHACNTVGSSRRRNASCAAGVLMSSDLRVRSPLLRRCSSQATPASLLLQSMEPLVKKPEQHALDIQQAYAQLDAAGRAAFFRELYEQMKKQEEQILAGKGDQLLTKKPLLRIFLENISGYALHGRQLAIDMRRDLLEVLEKDPKDEELKILNKKMQAIFADWYCKSLYWIHVC